MNNEAIIREALEDIVQEAKELYNRSGKRVTGQWEKGLKVQTSKNEGTLYSYEYLAGRGPTRNGNDGSPTLTQKIEQWIKDRGIKPIEEKMTVSSLAYVIARKIHREGTNKKYELQIWEEILTPQRIQDIIDMISELNVNWFVKNLQVEFEKLSKNI